MSRTIARATVALALALPLSLGAVSAPAQAAGACVSKAEFKKVKDGMRMKRVHRIFDTAGKQSFVMDSYQSREYKACTSTYGFVMVDFDHRKVESKTAFWG